MHIAGGQKGSTLRLY